MTSTFIRTVNGLCVGHITFKRVSSTHVHILVLPGHTPIPGLALQYEIHSRVPDPDEVASPFQVLTLHMVLKDFQARWYKAIQRVLDKRAGTPGLKLWFEEDWTYVLSDYLPIISIAKVPWGYRGIPGPDSFPSFAEALSHQFSILPRTSVHWELDLRLLTTDEISIPRVTGLITTDYPASPTFQPVLILPVGGLQ